MTIRKTPFLAPTLLSLAALAVVLTGCPTQEEEAPPAEPVAAAPAPQRVENADSGLVLADVPEGFDLVSNDAEGITLTRKPDLPPGDLVLWARPVQQAGVNLQKEVNEIKADFEGRPDGAFNGQLELMGPTGPAYSTRGRWTEGGREMEEVHLFALHPMENRVVDLAYTYEVTGDTKERMEQAMAVLGEVEAYTPDDTAMPEEGGEDGETPAEEPADEPAGEPVE
jgi:hypothetical protein